MLPSALRSQSSSPLGEFSKSRAVDCRGVLLFADEEEVKRSEDKIGSRYFEVAEEVGGTRQTLVFDDCKLSEAEDTPKRTITIEDSYYTYYS